MSCHRTLALLLLAAAPRVAAADTLEVTATTLLAGRADPRDGTLHTVVPALELVTLEASEIRNPYLESLRVVLSGWGGAELGEPARGQRMVGDLDLLYVDGGLGKGRVKLRAGRQLVVGGAARVLQLDGAMAQARIWRGLGASAYAGVPVTPEFGVHRGDSVAGGRAFYRHSMHAEAGVSFLRLLDRGQLAREDLALDARYAPHAQVTLTAFSAWSTVEKRLAEADAMAAWQIRPEVEVALDYRRVAPDLFLPRNSIFTVFAEENRDEAGGSVYLSPRARVGLRGDYHVVRNPDGTGHHGGGKATAVLGSHQATTLGVEARRLTLPGNAYTSTRAYARQALSPLLFATLDAEHVRLAVPRNGQRDAFTATASAACEVSPGWRLVVSGLGGTTPFLERRFELMAKLAYNFTRRFREVRQ
jgi:hypothetical protein